MNASIYRTTAVTILIAMLLPVAAAHAQLGDMLKDKLGGAAQGAGSTSSGGLGGLGGSLGGMGGTPSLQSLTSGSTGNVAGVLEFCIKNNYLSGGGAASLKDKLVGKLGGSPASDSGYGDGAKGILHSSDGQQLDLSGGGLKAQVTKQVCDKILAQGKSLL